MNDAVFISDLHLSAQDPQIVARFESWVVWALTHTRSVYILGDFFHAWAGDDTLDTFAASIATLLKKFHAVHIPVYLMVGNRDFLLGNQFCQLAQATPIEEPYICTWNEQRILLTHGDRYCTKDRLHQWFRRITRSRLFKHLFLCLPKHWRLACVQQVRMHSQQRRHTHRANLDVVTSDLIRHAKLFQADVVIHGHTHQPVHQTYEVGEKLISHFILSDWEENPTFLCYNEASGFDLIQFREVSNAFK